MHVILLAALTVNGYIAKHVDEPATWTSRADKQFFVEKTKAAGVMIMGKTTFKTIGRPLPGRLIIVLSKNPEQEPGLPGQIEYTNSPLPELLATLEKRGFSHVIVAGGASVYSQFLAQGLVNELFLTIEPRLFGAGINLLNSPGLDLSLALKESRMLDQNVLLLHYIVTQ